MFVSGYVCHTRSFYKFSSHHQTKRSWVGGGGGLFVLKIVKAKHSTMHQLCSQVRHWKLKNMSKSMAVSERQVNALCPELSLLSFLAKNHLLRQTEACSENVLTNSVNPVSVSIVMCVCPCVLWNVYVHKAVAQEMLSQKCSALAIASTATTSALLLGGWLALSLWGCRSFSRQWSLCAHGLMPSGPYLLPRALSSWGSSQTLPGAKYPWCGSSRSRLPSPRCRHMHRL